MSRLTFMELAEYCNQSDSPFVASADMLERIEYDEDDGHWFRAVSVDMVTNSMMYHFIHHHNIMDMVINPCTKKTSRRVNMWVARLTFTFNDTVR